jgi:hypothetical protein
MLALLYFSCPPPLDLETPAGDGSLRSRQLSVRLTPDAACTHPVRAVAQE